MPQTTGHLVASVAVVALEPIAAHTPKTVTTGTRRTPMTNQPPLNPDAEVSKDQTIFAYEAAERDYPQHGSIMLKLHHSNFQSSLWQVSKRTAESLRDQLNDLLAVAQPVVNSVPGVYDIGSPEPEGVDYVVECDERGVATDYLCSDAFSGYWFKTMDGTRWKGYQDGKVYMPWAELVRRVGPVKAVNDA